MERIIIGIDAEPASALAVEWVARRPGAAPSEITLVTAFDSFVDDPIAARDRQLAFADRLREALPSTRVEIELANASIPRALEERSRAADLLVIGSHRTRPVRSILSGGAPSFIAAQSHCPTVIVPDDWAARDGAIVVGVGLDDTSDPAVEFGVREAARTSSDLRLVHAWRGDGAGGGSSSERDSHRDRVAAVGARLRAHHPSIDISEHLVDGRIADALLAEDHAAQLIVIGTHHHGEPAISLFLGSTGGHLLMRSTIPVCIVPDSGDRVDEHPSADVELVDAAERAFLAADDIDPIDIEVTATDGTLHLRGEVATHAQRLAATEAAYAVPGVLAVKNRLLVRDLAIETIGMTDDEVSTSVARALLDSTATISDVEFTVRQHVATAQGHVGSSRDRAAIRYAIQHAPGVHFVIDEMEVAGDGRDEVVEELLPVACLRLLTTQTVGRLAIRDQQGIDVFPVNYVVTDGEIFFRSGPGTKMVRLTAAPEVTFEADGEEEGRLWSVVVRGVAERLGRDDQIQSSRVEAVSTSHPTEKFNYVRIRPLKISGRRFAPTASRARTAEG